MGKKKVSETKYTARTTALTTERTKADFFRLCKNPTEALREYMENYVEKHTGKQKA